MLDELGRGGMGVVYRALQRNLNRLVALKVILGGPLASAEDRTRFRAEAEAAARLQHPNIVQVYDVGEHAGFSYMALELVEGETLRAWQNGGRVEPRAAAALAATVARAVHHAHEQGIAHRDLKPGNILLHVESQKVESRNVEKPGFSDLTTLRLVDLRPKVTDFGLAKALIGGADLTVTGVACGTPNYMAPEQVRGKPPGPGMDVYGLGAVLYELLTGRPPFVGTDATEVMSQIMRVEPVSVRRLAPAVPRDLAVIVTKCLEKEPHRRYLTARDLADDLDRFLAGAPIAARPVGAGERAWRWARRNPVAAAFLTFLTIGCALTGGLALALARTASDERSARAGADAAREEAESARDGLRDALTATETARQQAEHERRAAALAKESADDAADRAHKKQQEANAARVRAEANLRVARGVIRKSMREFSNALPRFDEEEFRATRNELIRQVRQFRDTVAAQAPNTREWLDDLSDVSFFLGYLEYVNGNNLDAATEYRAAATAFGRWAPLEPHQHDIRARQGFSLVNVGNALRNANRFRDAEAAYLEACRLIDAVVPHEPGNLHFRHQAVVSYGKLAALYQTEGNTPGWHRAATTEADRAEALLRANAATANNLNGVAAAQQSLAQKLAGLRRWDEADCHFAGAVAVRERLRDEAPGESSEFEYSGALLTYAEFLASRGHPERADETFARAVANVEKVHAALPDGDRPAVELVGATARYADFFRECRRHSDAERLYDRAVELARAVIRRSPSYRPAWQGLASASVGRAHLYNATDRHRQAAAEWGRLAAEDPGVRARPGHDLFAVQSLLFARDWSAATAAANVRARKGVPDWMALEYARLWCLIAREIDADAKLIPADKLARGNAAVGMAVAYLERARAFGEFAGADRARRFADNPDFAPVRGKFDPQKK